MELLVSGVSNSVLPSHRDLAHHSWHTCTCTHTHMLSKSLQTLKILFEEQATFEKASMQKKSQGEVNRKRTLSWAVPGTEPDPIALRLAD